MNPSGPDKVNCFQPHSSDQQMDEWKNGRLEERQKQFLVVLSVLVPSWQDRKDACLRAETLRMGGENEQQYDQ